LTQTCVATMIFMDKSKLEFPQLTISHAAATRSTNLSDISSNPRSQTRPTQTREPQSTLLATCITPRPNSTPLPKSAEMRFNGRRRAYTRVVSLLRRSEADFVKIRFRISALFRQHQHITSPKAARDQLLRGHKASSSPHTVLAH
jgi:hypothetical protein